MNENILWNKMIDPISGRLESEPTFLGAVLEGVAFAVVLVVFVGAIMYL